MKENQLRLSLQEQISKGVEKELRNISGATLLGDTESIVKAKSQFVVRLVFLDQAAKSGGLPGLLQNELIQALIYTIEIENPNLMLLISKRLRPNKSAKCRVRRIKNIAECEAKLHIMRKDRIQSITKFKEMLENLKYGEDCADNEMYDNEMFDIEMYDNDDDEVGE